MFETTLTYSQIIETIENSDGKIFETFRSLNDKKIIIEANNRAVYFSSMGLKNYIYASITGKQTKHLKIAGKLRNNNINISKIELARQFELGEDFNSTFNVIIEYVSEIARYETYKYQLELLEKLSLLKLSRIQIQEIKIRLSEVYYKLGDLKTSYTIIKNLLSKTIKEDSVKEKLTLRLGECLVGTGKVVEGLKVYNALLPEVENKAMRKEIEYEIASARTYSGSIPEAESGLKSIIKDKNLSPELRAKSLNLLGIIEANYKNNVKESVGYFTEALAIYVKEKIGLKQAQVTKHIGNVYYMEGNYKEAEVFWKKSLNKNLEIGNLEEEATLLNNYGVLYFKNLDLEKSSENYKRALTIYKSLGRKFGEGLGYSNLSETYYYSSEYDLALNCIDKAKKLFIDMGDSGELCEVLLLKGYLLKSINDNMGLFKLLEEYRIVGETKTFSKKDLNHFRLLEAFTKNSDFNAVYSALVKIKDEYLSLGETAHFHKVSTILCEYLLANKKVNLAHEVIIANDFTGTITDSPFFKAYERFLLGKISYEQKNDSLKSNLEYYEEAYAVLHDCSITELTWRVISALAEAYMDRGNINKAVEYIHLTKSLLNHISLNIKDIRLRSLYLSAPERKSTIEKLSIWEKFIK